MFNIIKLIRNNDLVQLGYNLTDEINNIPQNWDGVLEFGLHGQNRKFVKHILSRISAYIDNTVGKDTTYVSYHNPKGKKLYTPGTIFLIIFALIRYSWLFISASFGDSFSVCINIFDINILLSSNLFSILSNKNPHLILRRRLFAVPLKLITFCNSTL